MLGPSRYGPRSLAADPLRQLPVGTSRVAAQWLRTGRCVSQGAQAFKPSTLWDTHGRATTRSRVFVAINSASRLFHVSRSSADGAQPRMPGWMRPANLTWGMCRLVQKIPSKSQMALALVDFTQYTCLEYDEGLAYAEGNISSRKPPCTGRQRRRLGWEIGRRKRDTRTPLRRSNTPVNPHGRSSNGWTSMISTRSRSPGIASSISKGPER